MGHQKVGAAFLRRRLFGVPSPSRTRSSQREERRESPRSGAPNALAHFLDISDGTQGKSTSLLRRRLFVVPSPSQTRSSQREERRESPRSGAPNALAHFLDISDGLKKTNPNFRVRICFFVSELHLQCRNSQCLQAKFPRRLPCSYK